MALTVSEKLFSRINSGAPSQEWADQSSGHRSTGSIIHASFGIDAARHSPEGFYLDSYDYAALRTHLLDPLAPEGSGRYRSAVYDHVTDSPLRAQEHIAPAGSVLILDGLFLHRQELHDHWDLSIFLEAPFEVTIARVAAREPGWESTDPDAPSNRRYVEGQRIYLRENQPQNRANVVIDYSDLTAPLVVAWRI